MQGEIRDYWKAQASIEGGDAATALRKVLDPNDRKGVKNSYIDAYLKYYLLRYLQPADSEILLEIGCGTGRLTEYVARFARAVYGIDIVEEFIAACNGNPHKAENTFYIHASEIGKLSGVQVSKLYVVWVLMYLIDEQELIATLKTYREALPHLKSATLIEQVTSATQLVYKDGRVDCCYRTIDEYERIFEAAGFKVKGHHVLGERHNAPLYRLLHLTRDILPRPLAGLTATLFWMDRALMGGHARRARLINNQRPTDVVFELEQV